MRPVTNDPAEFVSKTMIETHYTNLNNPFKAIKTSKWSVLGSTTDLWTSCPYFSHLQNKTFRRWKIILQQLWIDSLQVHKPRMTKWLTKLGKGVLS